MGMTSKGWGILIFLFIIIMAYLLLFGPLSFLVPGRGPVAAVVPKAVRLSNMANTASNVAKQPLPLSEPAEQTPQFYAEIMAWNSQFSWLYANGGPSTTKGSLMEKHGVFMQFQRQDDCEKMKAALIKFAQAYQSGIQFPQDAPAFIAVMGDGTAQLLAALNPMLEKLGPEYRAKIVASAGYSFGEDKVQGPAEVKRNPKLLKGMVFAGYLRDGDWNLLMKYAADNGIPNNPDETTYDPGAINWVAASDFLDAAAKCVAQYSEDRPEVINGKKTGRTVKITVKGCVTWTPGDVNVAEQLGGLVSIVSTKEYAGQMPNAIIGIDKWMQENRTLVEGMIEAMGEAGDQLKIPGNDEALARAGEISAEVYKEQDGAYWTKYHQGVVTQDKQGMTVELGGSKDNNLADQVLLFGPAGLLRSTYEAFGQVVVQQYPKLVKSFPPASDAIDGSYVLNVARKTGTSTAKADKYTFTSGAKIKEVVGNRKWQILFATGSARISEGQQDVLADVKNQLAVSLALKVIIHGHTDNVGKADQNRVLSEQRAYSVKTWLESNYPDIFPPGRIDVVGHGQDSPIADNSTEEGRRLNRRVQIVTGTVQ
jgi:OmpA-OmpF porin, OOP family